MQWKSYKLSYKILKVDIGRSKYNWFYFITSMYLLLVKTMVAQCDLVIF